MAISGGLSYFKIRFVTQPSWITTAEVRSWAPISTYLAEKRVDDHWEPAFETYYEPDDPDAERFLDHEEEFYFGGNRNYELYQILAGYVEPETGLTSRGFEPISPPRGYPEDVSDAVRQQWGDLDSPEARDSGCFGLSWLLLQGTDRLPLAREAADVRRLRERRELLRSSLPASRSSSARSRPRCFTAATT